MEGNLHKWTNYIKGWKLRYFMVENHVLYYSYSKSDSNKKAIKLNSVILIPGKNNKSFIIQIENKKVYLCSNTEEEASEWINFLEKEISMSKELEKFKELIKEKKGNNRKLSFKIVENNENNTPNHPNEKFENNKFKELTKLMQCFQNTYFNLSMELERMNTDINNSDKENAWFRNYYINLLAIKQEFKEFIDEGYRHIIILRECLEDPSSSVNKYTNYEKFHKLCLSKNEEENVINFGERPRILSSSQSPVQNILSEKEISNEEESQFEDCLEIRSEGALENKVKYYFIKKKTFILREDIYYDELYNFSRENLPIKIRVSNSMFSDMIKSIAKDKIELPIQYNEPLSMLQKICEKFQYSYHLSSAAKNTNKPIQLAHVAGFLMGEVSLNINRVLKPFNPILGETYEFIDNHSNFRYFSEQVSHHPPISAYICESEDFVMFGDTRCSNKFKFLKGAAELIFTNKTHLILKTNNHHITYNKPNIFLKGLIFGKPQYDFCGEITITNHTTNETLILEFFEEGKKNIPKGYVEGKVLDKDKKIQYFLKGSWMSALFLIECVNEKEVNKIDLQYLESNKINLDTKINNKEEITVYEIWRIKEDDFWKVNDVNDYRLSKYGYNLNHLTEQLKKVLPLNDSRFRPDQKALESQLINEAECEKLRIEEKQRTRHKFFVENNVKYEPKYFCEVLDTFTNEYIYLYNGDYWNDRKKGNYSEMIDIFSNV